MNFIDITPILHTADGAKRYVLGTVRYEVPDELIGELITPQVALPHEQTRLHAINSWESPSLSFEIKASTDRWPQPKLPPSIITEG